MRKVHIFEGHQTYPFAEGRLYAAAHLDAHFPPVDKETDDVAA
ncbi:MAG: hypothetical protein QNJ67_01005 [Kiloniellales bacterium]|nr:hypothetical protein [Kiloniellales bacterium]